jgi:uncharacterized protein YoxC
MDAIVEMVLELISKGGIIAILVILVIGLIYWINVRTVPKELYVDNNKKIDELKTEFRELVGPTLDRTMRIMEKQDQINNDLIRQVNTQGQVLSEIAKDLRIVTHELTMQRLEDRKPNNSHKNSNEN